MNYSLQRNSLTASLSCLYVTLSGEYVNTCHNTWLWLSNTGQHICIHAVDLGPLSRSATEEHLAANKGPV
jgi:hypothetical protein